MIFLIWSIINTMKHKQTADNSNYAKYTRKLEGKMLKPLFEFKIIVAVELGVSNCRARNGSRDWSYRKVFLRRLPPTILLRNLLHSQLNSIYTTHPFSLPAVSHSYNI